MGGEESPSAPARCAWTPGPGGRLRYTGDARALFQDGAGVSVEELFGKLGLEVPAGLTGTVQVGKGSPVSSPAASFSLVRQDGAGGQRPQTQLDTRWSYGINALEVITKKVLGEGITATCDEVPKLPPFEECEAIWETWLGMHPDVPPNQLRNAFADAKLYLQKTSAVDDALDTSFFHIDEPTDSMLLTNFLYGYTFADGAFWAQYDGEVWDTHRESVLIEQQYQRRMQFAVLPNGEEIDLMNMVSTMPASEGQPERKWTLRRVGEDEMEGEQAMFQTAFGYNYTAWWALGVEGSAHTVEWDDITREWNLQSRAVEVPWEECPLHLSAALEQLWGEPRESWTPPSDLTRYVNDQILRKHRAREDDNASPTSHLATTFRDQVERMCARAADAVVTMRRRSAVEAFGRRSSRCTSASPDSPRQTRAFIACTVGMDDISGTATSHQLTALTKDALERNTAAISAPPLTVVPAMYDDDDDEPKAPPLLKLLEAAFDGDNLLGVLATLEYLQGESANLYVSFIFNVVVVEERDLMSLYYVSSRLTNCRVAVAHLLSDDSRPEALSCMAMVRRAIRCCPRVTGVVCKQLPIDAVTIDMMARFRKGCILVNKQPWVVKGLIDGGMSEDEYFEDVVMFSMEVDAHELSVVSHRKRERVRVVLPCLLEVTTELSYHADDPGDRRFLMTMMKSIVKEEATNAKIRQLLTDCKDMRLFNTVGSAINGEQHLRLSYTDPKNSNRKVRIDKYKDEPMGIASFIPIITRYDPSLFAHSVRLAEVSDSPRSAESQQSSRPQSAAGSPTHKNEHAREEEDEDELFSLYGAKLSALQKPHLSHIVVCAVEHESCVERVGLTPGFMLMKINKIRSETPEHATRVIRMSRTLTAVSLEVATPVTDYAMWEVCNVTDHTSVISHESSILEKAYLTYLKRNERRPGQTDLERFKVDAAFNGTVVELLPTTDQYFTMEHIPETALETLKLMKSQTNDEWLRGELPPKSTATIIGAIKMMQPLRRVPKALNTAMQGGLKRTAADAHDPYHARAPVAAVDQNLRQFLEEWREKMEYPPPAFAAAMRRYRQKKHAGLPIAQFRRESALVIEAFLIEARAKRIGREARSLSLYYFTQWYRQSGYRMEPRSLYYFASLDHCNKMVLLHHSIVKVKDIVEYNFKDFTRKTLINGDPSRWTLDSVRRLPKVAATAIGDPGVNIISKTIELCPPGVRHLSLAGNDLTDASILYLVRALIYNCSIQSINVEDNNRIQGANKRSLACLIRCNSIECRVTHDDLQFIDLLEHVLAQRREIFPPHDQRIFLAKNALGMLCQKATQFEESEAYFRDALRDAELSQALRPCGETAHAVTTILYNLGTLYLAKGDLANGRDTFIKSFSGIMSVAGTKHFDVWASLSKIADFYFERRNYDKALFWYDFIAKELIASHGPRCHLLSAAKQNSAAVHVKNGDISYAILDLLYALNVIRNQRETDWLALFKCMHSIAEALGILAYTRAEWELNQQALHLLEHQYKENGLSASALAEGIVHLAQYYKDKADSQPPIASSRVLYQRAQELYQQALSFCQNLMPARHPDFIELSLQHASTQLCCGRADDAYPTIEKAVATCEALFGMNRPVTGEANRWLARYHHVKGDYETAAGILKKAISRFDDKVRSPIVANLLYDYGLSCASIKKFSESETALLRCLQMREASLGVDSPAVAATMLALAKFYHQMGMYEHGEDFAKRYLTVRLQRYPETRAHVMHAIDVLATIRRHQGKSFEYQELSVIKQSMDHQRNVHQNVMGSQSLQTALKNLGALYTMKEVSWEARMEYLTVKASRSFPLDMIKALPPYNPLKRQEGLPLSTIEQAQKLAKLEGLNRLVRHARVVRPGEVWKGILALERAVLTMPPASSQNYAELMQKGRVEEGELSPMLFGSADPSTRWTVPKAYHSDLYSNALAFLFNAQQREISLRDDINSDPIISSACFVIEQLATCAKRIQQSFGEQIMLFTTRGLLRKFFRLLRLHAEVSKANARTRFSRLTSPEDTAVRSSLEQAPPLAGSIKSRSLTKMLHQAGKQGSSGLIAPCTKSQLSVAVPIGSPATSIPVAGGDRSPVHSPVARARAAKLAPLPARMSPSMPATAGGLTAAPL